jgi:predicted amidohydrolase
MSQRVTVACVQNCPVTDTAANLRDCSQLVRQAAAEGAELIALPEYFSSLDVDASGRLIAPAFSEQAHPALAHFRALAAELGVTLSLGSLAITAPGGKAFNRGYLLAPDGAVAARYDKLHLFDIALKDGEVYRESDTVRAGNAAVLAETRWGPIGLSICYDLRFPHLYRTLAKAGAGVLLVPAAFTKTTGEAHWHVLLRARAIETGAYVVAACQCGAHASGAASYGHSLIVDPWGRVIADGGEEPGIIVAEIDLAKVAEARAMIPALSHDRAFSVSSKTSLAEVS